MKRGPFGEIGSRFYPAINPDYVSRDEETRKDPDEHEACEGGPGDQFPVDCGAGKDLRGIEDEPYKGHREAEEDEDEPPHPVAGEGFTGVPDRVVEDLLEFHGEAPLLE